MQALFSFQCSRWRDLRVASANALRRLPVPRPCVASRRESQQANLDALKVRLDDDDRKAIAALPKDKRCVNPGFGPAWD